MSVRAVARSVRSSGAPRVPGMAVPPRRVAGAVLALLLTGSLAGTVAVPALAVTAQTYGGAARFSPEATADFPASPANWHMDQFEPIPGSTDVYTPDVSGSGHSLRLSEGVGRAPGSFALNQGRPDDQALTFDGTAAGVASTAGPLVRMFDGSGFSASAFVRADDVAPGSQTVVSQDGEIGSGFRLERLSAGDGCPDGLQTCWGFRMYDSDGGGSVLATSDRPVTAGEWVHLAGVFTTSTNQLSLSVCPVPVDPDGRDPEGTGIPVVDPEAGTVAYTGSPWVASGPVQVGRSQVDGSPSDHWNGAIDEVRLYSEPLTSGRIMRICTGSPR
jgi:Concanavalin A-like lectin/glucanases superfamily